MRTPLKPLVATASRQDQSVQNSVAHANLVQLPVTKVHLVFDWRVFRGGVWEGQNCVNHIECMHMRYKGSQTAYPKWYFLRLPEGGPRGRLGKKKI